MRGTLSVRANGRGSCAAPRAHCVPRLCRVRACEGRDAPDPRAVPDQAALRRRLLRRKTLGPRTQGRRGAGAHGGQQPHLAGRARDRGARDACRRRRAGRTAGPLPRARRAHRAPERAAAVRARDPATRARRGAGPAGRTGRRRWQGSGGKVRRVHLGCFSFGAWAQAHVLGSWGRGACTDLRRATRPRHSVCRLQDRCHQPRSATWS